MSSPAGIALRLLPAPRPVPLSLRISTIFNPIAQIGFFLLAFSSPFFWMFVAHADISALTFHGGIDRTNGTVINVVETNASEGKGRVYEVHYAFSVNAHGYTGVSWISGDSPSSGDVVTVEYRRSNPDSSRVEGMRRDMFGAGALVAAIFPLIGLAVVFGSMKWGAKQARLLEHGVAVEGTLVRREATNVRVNRRTVWALTFEFSTLEGAKREATVRTSNPDTVPDNARELVLYDPERPDSAVRIDDLYPLPEIDDGGAIRGVPVRALLSSILPALVIGGNGMWIWRLVG